MLFLLKDMLVKAIICTCNMYFHSIMDYMYCACLYSGPYFMILVHLHQPSRSIVVHVYMCVYVCVSVCVTVCVYPYIVGLYMCMFMCSTSMCVYVRYVCVCCVCMCVLCVCVRACKVMLSCCHFIAGGVLYYVATRR